MSIPSFQAPFTSRLYAARMTKNYGYSLAYPAEYWTMNEVGNGSVARVGKINKLELFGLTGGGSSANDISGVSGLVSGAVQFLCLPSTFPIANAPNLKTQNTHGAFNYDPLIGTGFTFSFWSKPVYFDSVSNVGGMVAGSITSPFGFSTGATALFSSGLKVQFSIAGATTFNLNVTSTSTAWHHIAITYLISGGVATYYYDGASIHSQSGVSVPKMASGNISFNEAFQNTGVTPPSNVLDEVFWSGRICATAGQIATIYNGGAGCTLGDGTFPFALDELANL